MRTIAILAVVAIHTTTKALGAYSFAVKGSTFGFFINQICRFAVPLFFMISGFVLELNYSQNQNYFIYLKKRFSKIILPYLFWSAIYYYFIYTRHSLSYFQSLLGGNASYQLYFIPTLLIFYIAFPLLHRLYRFIANKWVLIILGIIQIILLAYVYYIGSLRVVYPLAIALLNFYVFILGMVASHHQDFLQKITKRKVLFAILSVIFALAVFLQGKYFYLKTHNYLYFYTQWRPSVLFYTLTFAGFLYGFYNKLKLNEKAVSGFSKLSFFVFFVHVIVLEQFWNIIGKKIVNIDTEIFFNLFFFFAVAGISYAIAYLARKIPHLPKLTG